MYRVFGTNPGVAKTPERLKLATIVVWGSFVKQFESIWHQSPEVAKIPVSG